MEARTRRRISLVVAALAMGALALAPGSAMAHAKTVWLCRPGLDRNPCNPSLKTTRLSNDGQTALGTYAPDLAGKPKIDCFYVYPTVSDDKSDNSDLSIDPEERSIALYQAARYSQQCRVFAPMYRQVTLQTLFGGTTTPKISKIAYASALSAWKEYLAKFNHGRPFVLIGHSQGSFILRQLIGERIDNDPALRKRLVSALLLGGNVLVKKGKDTGGDFDNIGACHSQTQLHCVVAWSTFNDTVPQDAVFGRVDPSLAGKLQVLCAYPGSSNLQVIVPTKPFAPGTTIGVGTSVLGFPDANATTPWAEYDHAYTGSCSSADGANVLQITGNPGAPHLNPLPDATWGIHLADANIALGNLTHLVRRETKSFFGP